MDSDGRGDREGYSFFLNRIFVALDSFFRSQTIYSWFENVCFKI